jgi:hypothetical protein
MGTFLSNVLAEKRSSPRRAHTRLVRPSTNRDTHLSTPTIHKRSEACADAHNDVPRVIAPSPPGSPVGS